MHEPLAASEARLDHHLRVLTSEIGVRLAGSPAESAAAAYIQAEFERVGAVTSLETFPVRERAVTEEVLQVQLGGDWVSFPCSLFSSTPGTDGETLEAPLCFFEAAAEYRLADLSHLRGKAVVHLGCHIESREHYRRLMSAEPAFLLFVDVRYPGSAPLADGMFPSYTASLGARPTVNVAYMDAWRWKVEDATSARLTVRGGMRPGTSQNVIAELPGRDLQAGTLYVGGHHDTQANSVGADDNASGVAALLELARVLSTGPRQRTIRLVSFGAEEQLSIGSASYVREHRREVMEEGRFVLNFDSYASHLGWTVLDCCGPAGMADLVLATFDAAGLPCCLSAEVIPYTDLFPFVAAGTPGVYVGRDNCTAGRFFHHRPDDDMSRVSVPLMARTVEASADLLRHLSTVAEMPFPATVPPKLAADASRFWEDLFGGW